MSGRILAVESSCDETAVAVVERGRRIVASVVASVVMRAEVQADPANLGARLALGRALAASHQYEPALAQLLEIIKLDAGYEDDAARKAMLDLFEVMGPRDPLTQTYRRALAQYLFK